MLKSLRIILFTVWKDFEYQSSNNDPLQLNKLLHSSANILISYITFERLNTTKIHFNFNIYRISSLYTVSKEKPSSLIRLLNEQINTNERYIFKVTERCTIKHVPFC